MENLRSARFVHRLIIPYTHNKMRSQEEKLFACGDHSLPIYAISLPPKIWAEAIHSLNYIRNRCIAKGISEGTLFERWKGCIPNLSHMQTFEIYMLNKKPKKENLIFVVFFSGTLTTQNHIAPGYQLVRNLYQEM